MTYIVPEIALATRGDIVGILDLQEQNLLGRCVRRSAVRRSLRTSRVISSVRQLLPRPRIGGRSLKP
jgi:hypothetical protein